MTDITISIEHLSSLTQKLDALELTEDERATLNAVVAAAGQAVTKSNDDVSGFAFDAFIREIPDPTIPHPAGGSGVGKLSPGGGSLGSFSWGVSSPPGTIGIVL